MKEPPSQLSEWKRDIQKPAVSEQRDLKFVHAHTADVLTARAPIGKDSQLMAKDWSHFLRGKLLVKESETFFHRRNPQ